MAGSGRGRLRSELDVSLRPRLPLGAARPPLPWAVSTGEFPALTAPPGLLLLPSSRESAIPVGGNSSRGRSGCRVPRAKLRVLGAVSGWGRAGCHLGHDHSRDIVRGTVSASRSDPINVNL